MSIYSLPEGTDPDEFWEYHTEDHAVDFVKVAGLRLKKYVINRVIDTHPVSPMLSEETKFFDIVETWWENEEVMNQVYKEIATVKTASGKTIQDDFLSRVSWGVSLKVEELVVKNIT